MPDNHDFGFNVIVGKEALYEFTGSKDNRIYIESTMCCPDSYHISSNSGEMMVTPYKILLEPAIDTPSRFYYLHIDGQSITRAFLHGGQKRVFTGVLQSGVLNEFVFTAPIEGENPTEKNSTEKKCLDKIGEIMITVRHAIDTGKTDTCCRFTFSPVRTKKHESQLDTVQNVTKKDVMKITGGQYPMLNTGIGRPVEYRRTIPASTRIRRIFRQGCTISSISLYYRPKQTLLALGVIQDDEIMHLDSAKENSPPSPKKTSSKEMEALEKKLTDMQTSDKWCKEDKVKLCELDTDCVDTTECEKATIVKQESMSDSDSEYDLWEDGDRSIIWQGDDDCYITMVRKPNDISMVELSDDEGALCS